MRPFSICECVNFRVAPSARTANSLRLLPSRGRRSGGAGLPSDHHPPLVRTSNQIMHCVDGLTFPDRRVTGPSPCASTNARRRASTVPARLVVLRSDFSRGLLQRVCSAVRLNAGRYRDELAVEKPAPFLARRMRLPVDATDPRLVDDGKIILAPIERLQIFDAVLGALPADRLARCGQATQPGPNGRNPNGHEKSTAINSRNVVQSHAFGHARALRDQSCALLPFPGTSAVPPHVLRICPSDLMCAA